MSSVLQYLTLNPKNISKPLDLDDVSHIQSSDIDEDMFDVNLLVVKHLFMANAWVHILKQGKTRSILTFAFTHNMISMIRTVKLHFPDFYDLSQLSQPFIIIILFKATKNGKISEKVKKLLPTFFWPYGSAYLVPISCV